MSTRLGYTVSELLMRMSGRELAEWEAYLTLEARVQTQVRQGMDPGLADQMIWSTPADEDEVRDSPPKRKPKGKGK